MPKQITEAQKLEAFALYTMASIHYEKCRQFEAGCSAILGAKDGDYLDAVSDAIYGYDAGKPQPFDQMLDYAGVTVKPSKRKTR